jgi:hypothetical protein
MSNAKAILAERLAKGEINEEEFVRLSATIEGEQTVPNSIAPATSQRSVGIVPPARQASLFSKIVAVVSLGFCAFAFIIFPMSSKNKDIADMRSKCDSLRFNCQCVVQNLEKNISIIYYIPIVRQFVRPSASDLEARVTGYISACRR